jgi:hypothetical protein
MSWIAIEEWMNEWMNAFVMEPASLVKSMWLLKKGCLQNCRRNHWENSCSGRISSGRHCKCYGYNNCSWITRHTLVRAICSAPGTWRTSAMHVSVCTVQQTLFVEFCRPWFTAGPPLMRLSLAWNRRGFRSLCWGYCSYVLTAASPLPGGKLETECVALCFKRIVALTLLYVLFAWVEPG